MPVVPKKALQILVFVLPLCLVGFAVLAGGASLVRAMNDEAGARVLAWIAAAVLMLGIADLLLLVTVLGLRALNDEADESSGGDG
ncbi:MAG: hypothetical protein JJ992_00775 [Planctomycetes bacterium]|nr:hypothetical protein [Planctomycetota bacterium]